MQHGRAGSSQEGFHRAVDVIVSACHVEGGRAPETTWPTRQSQGSSASRRRRGPGTRAPGGRRGDGAVDAVVGHGRSSGLPPCAMAVAISCPVISTPPSPTKQMEVRLGCSMAAATVRGHANAHRTHNAADQRVLRRHLPVPVHPGGNVAGIGDEDRILRRQPGERIHHHAKINAVLLHPQACRPACP